MCHGPESGVTDWVIDHPETLLVFKELGIDYSCGGKSLEYACRQQGHDVQFVMSKLQEAIASGERDNSAQSSHEQQHL